MIFLVTKDKIKRNIIKKTQYITNLPTFSQIVSTIFTYDEINFDIIKMFFIKFINQLKK